MLSATTEPRILVIGEFTNINASGTAVANLRFLIVTFCFLFVPGLIEAADEKNIRDLSNPTTDAIMQKLAESDRLRSEKLFTYTSYRRYFMENLRFKKSAEMRVKLTFHHPDRKEFEIIAEHGPAPVRNQVFRRMLKSEQDSAGGAQKKATQVSLENYAFQFLNIEMLDGRKSYVLAAEPKTKNGFLFRGKVWIDAQDFAVAKIEGSPAQNPSIWVRKTSFVHRYTKIGEFWLALSNVSETDVVLFGKTQVRIEYGDYRVNDESKP